MSANKAIVCKWLISLLLIMQGYLSSAQLKAAFTANYASGCSPIVVKFSDTSTGNPTNWKWDLGNGTVSFLPNPSVTYFTPGQYSVKLVISNAGGKDSIIKMQYITVYASAVIDFYASDTTGCFPLPITFTDLSIPGSGNIDKWEWDFGDGITTTGYTARHIYDAAGNYNVSLRITNSFGCTKSITKPQYIKLNNGVLAHFNIQKSNTCKAPATINFTNTSSGSSLLSYQWDFGDGSGSTLANPAHIYTKDGKYNVKLVVKNSTGCTDTLTRVNAIILGNTHADFSAPLTACQGSTLNIINTSTPFTAGVRWDFGDGSFSTDSIASKQYASAGNYIIKMIADFGACSDSVSKSIVVSAKPVINFTADKTSDCKVPFTVKFTQNVVGGVSYLWDFGDNTSSAVQNPTHTYNTPGMHDVTLIAANISGCSDTLIKSGFIQIQLPEVSLPDLPVSDCAPFPFTFKSTVIATAPVIGYKWDFGDGSTSLAASPSHTFLQPGSYTISVIITTAGGCTDTAIVADGVIVGAKPVALFSATPRNTCASFPVGFSDLSTGKVDKWLWQFGDGGSSVDQNPTHIYTDTGYFNVSLIVASNGCTDTIQFNKYIHITPPVANFWMAFDCAIPLQRVFTDKSIGADTWFWNFGDSTTSGLRNPVHSYPGTGNYLVSLTVTNSTTGCSFTKPTMISVIDEKANFTASDTVVCKGIPINFNTVNINGVSIGSYYWDFGDGTSLSATGSVAHTYNVAGNYPVTLIITN
ncbi:MAG: PKD domain-containing protein, partial [Ginsengibacter sp.]